MTVPESVAVSICAKLNVLTAIQHSNIEQERTTRTNLRPKSGQCEDSVIGILLAPVFIRNGDLFPPPGEKVEQLRTDAS